MEARAVPGDEAEVEGVGRLGAGADVRPIGDAL